MAAPEVSRRTLIKTAALGSLASTLNVGALGRAFAADLTVGIVYVGARDDFGWNQAHAVAAAALKKVPGVNVVEEENVPETDACAKTMESMINLDGAGLILATSFGYYTPFVVDMAKKYPKVEFRHAAPLWNKDKDPKNAGSYFGYLNQAHYVDGVAAGLSTKSNKIGFVAAKPIASVLSNINSVHARRAQDQSEGDRPGDLHRRLVDAGARGRGGQRAGRRRLRRHHLPRRSPKVVIETAEKRGVKSCGHNASQAPLAPKGFITGAEYKWSTIYKGYAADLAAGKTLPNFTAGGYESRLRAEHAVRRRRDRGRAKAATAAIADMKNKEPIYVGPLKDNKTGKVVIDKTYGNLDPYLDKMNYLLEGVVGSIT